MSRIHVLHENSLWLPPLAVAFNQRGLAWTEWFMDGGIFDLSVAPPEGIFYNRMSASSHTRDHRYAAELTAGVLAWLAAHGRRVVNGSGALDLEISKARQYAALTAQGVATPRSILVAGRQKVLDAARLYYADRSVILKPNRGGKGLGVRLFHTLEGLTQHVRGDEYEEPIDGLVLLQDYIRAPEPFITRAEFVGGRFLYAVRVDTSEGFELCPAEACEIGDLACPVGEAPQGIFQGVARHKFEILPAGIPTDLRARLERVLADAGVEVAGIEFIADEHGRLFVYDINTNTNYNPEAEERDNRANTNRSGPGALAAFLGGELSRLYPVAA